MLAKGAQQAPSTASPMMENIMQLMAVNAQQDAEARRASQRAADQQAQMMNMMLMSLFAKDPPTSFRTSWSPPPKFRLPSTPVQVDSEPAGDAQVDAEEETRHCCSRAPSCTALGSHCANSKPSPWQSSARSLRTLKPQRRRACSSHSSDIWSGPRFWSKNFAGIQ